jgi:hypothetical protein
MLSLAEETTLLLYSGMQRPDGTTSHDTFSKYGSSSTLVSAALLMDLALRGHVRMESPQTPEQRTRVQWVPVAVAIILVFGLAFFGAILFLTNVPAAPSFVIAVPFIFCALLIMTVALIAGARTGKMVIVDASPIGDGLLDDTLQHMARIGSRASIQTYLRRCFSFSTLRRYLAALRQQLELRGYVRNTGQRSTFLGLVEVRQVDRQHPDFRAIGERLRSLILGGAATSPDALALALLFSRERSYAAPFGGGSRPLRGVDQFFTREELPTLRRRLKQIRTGDPTITALLGNDVYDTLVAIILAVEARRSQSSGSG